MSWIGRGNENVPGRPFGWAHNMERRELRDRLRRKGNYRPGFDPRLESRITRIVERLRRNEPTYRERHAAWRARQPKPTSANVTLSIEELARLVEHFAGANDPISAAIGAKAAAELARLRS